MSEAHTKPRWFQFTISRILWATFWMGVSFGSWVVLSRTVGPSDAVGFATTAGVLLGPFVAVGALFGRPLVGLAVGMALVGAYALAVYVAINNGWVSFP